MSESFLDAPSCNRISRTAAAAARAEEKLRQANERKARAKLPPKKNTLLAPPPGGSFRLEPELSSSRRDRWRRAALLAEGTK